MKVLRYKSVRSARAYDDLLDASYVKVKPKVEEVDVPPVHVIAVAGNEPPGSKQFQEAIGILYGVAYTLKMGLKFRKLPRPKGYFDYKVGALEAVWWSTRGPLEINDPKTLRWQAYLMVPAFVTKKLVEEAGRAAKVKHPEVPYEKATLETIDEGRAVQVLHVGPYDKEQPTIERLRQYAVDHGLGVTRMHHEIYISDPGRTKPDKLKTVIRFPVKTRPVRTAPSR